MRFARSSTLLSLLVLGSALAGCAVPSAEPASSASTAATPPAAASESPIAPSPSAAPEPVPESTTGAPELVVTADGLGPLMIGSPVSTDGVALVAYTTEDCATGYWATGDAHTSSSGGYAHDGGPSFTIWAGGESAPVQRIDVLDPAIETDRGVAVGDPVDEVRAAYPEAEEAAGASVSRLYVIPGDSGQLVIEVAGDDAAYWREAAGTVAFVRVLEADAVPTAIAATDDTVGACRG